MDFILDNIKVVIGLVIAFFWIVGKISEAKKKRAEQQPWAPPDDGEYPPQEYYEPEEPEAYRRPMVPPPLPQFVAADDGELTRQRVMHERLNALRKEKGSNGKAKGAFPAKSRANTKPVKAAAASFPSIKAHLRDPREIRRAIVIKEILDPPVALR